MPVDFWQCSRCPLVNLPHYYKCKACFHYATPKDSHKKETLSFTAMLKSPHLNKQAASLIHETWPKTCTIQARTNWYTKLQSESKDPTTYFPIIVDTSKEGQIIVGHAQLSGEMTIEKVGKWTILCRHRPYKNVRSTPTTVLSTLPRVRKAQNRLSPS